MELGQEAGAAEDEVCYASLYGWCLGVMTSSTPYLSVATVRVAVSSSLYSKGLRGTSQVAIKSRPWKSTHLLELLMVRERS